MTHDSVADTPSRHRRKADEMGSPIILNDFNTLVLACHSSDIPVGKENHATSPVLSKDPTQTLVPLSTDQTTLFGFNGEPCFFTRSQVFFTTTGLRAVSPSAARRLAPGIEIGPLHPGHILYHVSKDGASYENVRVETILSQESSVPRCSVLLPRGTSSFHANKYLARAAQPDLEVLKTAKATAQLSLPQRLAALETLPESAPYFKELGNSGVSRLLENELQQGHFRLTSPVTPVHRVSAVPIHTVRRTWNLSYHDNNAIDIPSVEYRLPQISLYEGVLHIHGNIIAAAVVDSSTSIVTWSRQINDEWYEHGNLHISEHGLTGDGAILLSQDPNHQHLDRDDDCMVASVHAVKSVGHLRAEKKQSMLVPASVDFQAGDGTEDDYMMTLDLGPWLKGQPQRTEPSRPMSFGSIRLGTQNIGGSKGIEIPAIQIPALDELRDIINASTEGVDIGSLYTSTMNLTGRSKPTGVVNMTNVDLIAQMADPFSEEDPFNLTFQQHLQSNIVLPMLFQELHVELQDQRLTGAAFLFNPDMRGCIGRRHLVTSEIPLGTASSTINTRFALAKDASAAKMAPALVTAGLGDLDIYSVQDLMLLQDYDEAKIHAKTQDLVRDMMLYHMKESDRINLLSVPKRPTDLPFELADGLDNASRSWLSSVYAPAVICHSATQASWTTKSKWRQRLSLEEENKTWYFFTGKGPNCLSRSKEYNQITHLASISAMKILFKRIQVYINSGGRYWARLALACFTDPASLRALERTPIEGGVNYANKIANILTCLDRSGTYAKDLFNAMYGHSISEALRKPYLDTSDEGAESATETIKSVFIKLGTAVLEDTNDFGLTQEMREDLLSSIEEVEKALQLAQTGSSVERLQEIIDQHDDFLSLLGKSMSPHDLEDLKPHAEMTMKMNDKALALDGSDRSGGIFGTIKGSAGYAWISAKYDATQKFMFPEGSQNLAALKGIMTLGMSANLIYAAMKGFSAWDLNSDSQKSILIESSIESVLGVVTKAFESWKAWKLAPDMKALAQYGAIMDWIQIKEKAFITKLSERMDILEGPNSIQRSTSSRIHQNGKPSLDDAQAAERKLLDVVFDEYVKGGEKLKAFAGKVTRIFNIAMNVIDTIGIMLSIALVVSMSLDLKDQWNNLNTWGKAVAVIDITIAALSIVCNQIIVNVLVAVGAILANSATALALPGIGTVLAVIGIIVAVLAFIFQTRKPPPPPPLTPIEEFIAGSGRNLIRGWNSQPSSKLAYVVQPTTARYATGNRPTIISITGENKKTPGSLTSLSRLTLTFLSGAAEGSLFSNLDFQVVDRTNPRKDEIGNIYVTRADNIEASVKMEPRDNGSSASVEVTLVAKVTGDHRTDMKILFGALVGVVVVGAVRSGPGSSVLQIVEDFPGDGDKSGTFPVIQIT